MDFETPNFRYPNNNKSDSALYMKPNQQQYSCFDGYHNYYKKRSNFDHEWIYENARRRENQTFTKPMSQNIAMPEVYIHSLGKCSCPKQPWGPFKNVYPPKTAISLGSLRTSNNVPKPNTEGITFNTNNNDERLKINKDSIEILEQKLQHSTSKTISGVKKRQSFKNVEETQVATSPNHIVHELPRLSFKDPKHERQDKLSKLHDESNRGLKQSFSIKSFIRPHNKNCQTGVHSSVFEVKESIDNFKYPADQLVQIAVQKLTSSLNTAQTKKSGNFV